MLGRKVASAFRYQGAFFTSEERWEALTDGPPLWLVSLPHPSGLNRMWNVEGADRRARDLLRSVAPGVPWGETDETCKHDAIAQDSTGRLVCGDCGAGK